MMVILPVSQLVMGCGMFLPRQSFPGRSGTYIGFKVQKPGWAVVISWPVQTLSLFCIHQEIMTTSEWWLKLTLAMLPESGCLCRWSQSRFSHHPAHPLSVAGRHGWGFSTLETMLDIEHCLLQLFHHSQPKVSCYVYPCVLNTEIHTIFISNSCKKLEVIKFCGSNLTKPEHCVPRHSCSQTKDFPYLFIILPLIDHRLRSCYLQPSLRSHESSVLCRHHHHPSSSS